MDSVIDFFTNQKVIQVISIFIIGFILKAIIGRVVHKSIKDSKKYYKIKKGITYTYFALMIMFLIIIYYEVDSLSTYFGLVSAGLAIALKDLIINIAAWLFILIKKPFDVGDRIEINGHAGDVIDKRLFQFTLMEIGEWVSNDQSTGRLIHLPNSIVFSSALANFTSGFKYIWNEIDVLLTFESDYKKAKPIFLKIAEEYSLHLTKRMEKDLKEASKKYMIHYNNLTPIVYTDVKENGIMLSIRYLCIPQQRRNTIESIWEDVLNYINENEDVNLAYSTMRIIKDN